MSTLARTIVLATFSAALPTAALADAAPSDSAAHDHESSVVAGSDTTVLDLTDVLRRVLHRNPTLAAAKASWSEARARARQAGTWENPMLDFMAAPSSFGRSSVEAAYRIGVTQSIPVFGRRGLQRRAAEAEARMSAWDLRTAQLDLVREARLAFVEYWRIDRAIALNRELLGLLPEFRRVSLAKYSAGLVGQEDPLQVDAELAMLDHMAVVLDRQRRVAVARLNVLMHDPPETWLPPTPKNLSLPDTVVIHGNLAPRARALRPEMRSIDALVEARRADVTLAGRRWAPEPSLGVSYDRYWSEPELRTSVELSLNLPINGGRVSAAQTEARDRLEAGESLRQAVQDSVEFQVAAAAARLHEQAHDVAIARERMIPLAERTLRASRASYESNRTDFLTVLNSLRDFLRARLEADESVAMLHEARADLDRALGEFPSELEKEKLP